MRSACGVSWSSHAASSGPLCSGVVNPTSKLPLKRFDPGRRCVLEQVDRTVNPRSLAALNVASGSRVHAPASRVPGFAVVSSGTAERPLTNRSG